MVFLGASAISGSVSTSILIMIPILAGIAWLLRNISIIPSATARPGSAVPPRRQWAVLLAPVGAILLLSFGLFSQRNTLLAFRYLAPPAWSRDAQYLNDVLRRSAHLGEYGLLFLLAFRGPLRGRRSLALGLCLAVALADEGHQWIVPERTGSLGDVGLDLLGAMMANVADLVVGFPALSLKRGGSTVAQRHAR